VGDLLGEDCTPTIKGIRIPEDKLGELQIRLEQNQVAMKLALNWARNFGQGAVAAALGAFPKFNKENPLPRGTEQPIEEEERPMIEASPEFAAILMKELGNNEQGGD
jgi:hypothetical protein